MTCSAIINKVDELMPNQYSAEMKLSWLNNCDGKIWNEIILTHVGVKPGSKFEEHTLSDELIVPFPYGDEIYCYWLEAQISFQNQEVGKYNQFITMFTAKLNEYASRYNQTHRPAKRARIWW